MRRAGRVVGEMHARIREVLRPGVTLLDLDTIGAAAGAAAQRGRLKQYFLSCILLPKRI